MRVRFDQNKFEAISKLVHSFCFITIFAFLSAQADLNALGIDVYAFPHRSDLHKIIATTDSGYLLLGTYFFDELNYDAMLMKLDSSGRVLWKRAIGETRTIGSFESGVDVIQRSNGTILAVGGGNIYRLNSAGALLSKEEFAGGSIRRILLAAGGGYLVAGDTPEPGNLVKRNLFITKINENNLIEWSRTYAHSTSSFMLTSFKPVLNGFLITGYIFGNPYTYVLKVSPAGNIIWQKRYLLRNVIAEAYSSGDKIYLIGHATGRTGTVRVVRINQLGNVLWSREIKSGDLRIEAVRTGPSGVIIAGESSLSQTSKFLLKISHSGAVQSLTTFPEVSQIRFILGFHDHFTFLARKFNERTRRSDVVVIHTQRSGFIPGCFVPQAIPFTSRTVPVKASLSQVSSGNADTSLIQAEVKLTSVTLKRTRVCF